MAEEAEDTEEAERLEGEEEPGESEGPEGLRCWDAAEKGDTADSASFNATAPPSTSCLLTRAVRHQELKLPLHRMTQRFGRNPQRNSTGVTNLSRNLDSSYPRGTALPPRHEEHTHSSGLTPNQPPPSEHTATNRPQQIVPRSVTTTRSRLAATQHKTHRTIRYMTMHNSTRLG